MPIDPYRPPLAWIWGERIILLAATPFLLFPTFAPIGTLLALLALAAVWLLPLLLFRHPLLPPTPFNVALLLWALALMIGIIVTADPDLTLPKATSLILGLATWRYLAWAVTDRKSLHWSVTGFALLAAGFTLLGILGANWFIKIPFLDDVVRRLPTTLITLPENAGAGVHTNQLAGTILFYWPLLLSALIGWQPRPRLIRIGLLLLSLLATAILLLTQSRSGWLGGFGSLLILLCLWARCLPPSPRRQAVWFSLGLLLAIAVTGAILTGPDRLAALWRDPGQETILGNLGSISFRQEVWRWSLAGIRDFPLTGTGLGTFRQVVRRFYPLAVPPTYDIAHAHNIFLQTALDVGLPGLIAYIAILLLSAGLGWQVARQDQAMRPVALGLLAALAAIHLYGLADALAVGSKPALLFWVLLGLLTAMHRLSLHRL